MFKLDLNLVSSIVIITFTTSSSKYSEDLLIAPNSLKPAGKI